MAEDKRLLTPEEFHKLHEDFFGEGSGTCCEIDDTDLCYRVAKAQLAKADKHKVGNERIYPCSDCGKLRSKKEGGTIFTVCDECWDKHLHAEIPNYECHTCKGTGKLDSPDREKILHEICCACVHKPLTIKEGLFNDSPKTYEGCGCYQNLEGNDYCQIAIRSANQIIALLPNVEEAVHQAKMDSFDKGFKSGLHHADDKIEEAKREERDKIGLGFRQLQAEAREWTEKNFPNGKSYHPFLGIVEEVGELAHAHLKREQGIRTEENHIENQKDAIGDIVMFLCDYCSRNSFDLEECVRTVWEEVKQRNWQSSKEEK